MLGSHNLNPNKKPIYLASCFMETANLFLEDQASNIPLNFKIFKCTGKKKKNEKEKEKEAYEWFL